MNETNLGRVTLGEIFAGLSRLFTLPDQYEKRNEYRNEDVIKNQETLKTVLPEKASFSTEESVKNRNIEKNGIRFSPYAWSEIHKSENGNDDLEENNFYQENFNQENSNQGDFNPVNFKENCRNRLPEKTKGDSPSEEEKNVMPIGIPSSTDLPVLENAIDYRNFKAINWSTLKRFLDDPRWFSLHPDLELEVTEAMKLGSMVHCAVLEKEKFADLYASFTAPINEKTGEPYKSGKIYESAREAFEQSGKIACTTDQQTICSEIVRSLNDYGLLDILSPSESSSENRVVTEVPLYDSRQELKGKIDCYNEQYGLLEFKTVSSPIHDAFGRDLFGYKIRQYGYLYQMAFYAKIIYNQTGFIPPCWIIAAETTSPYRCGVYEISEKKILEALERIDGEFLPLYHDFLNGTLDKRPYSFVL